MNIFDAFRMMHAAPPGGQPQGGPATAPAGLLDGSGAPPVTQGMPAPPAMQAPTNNALASTPNAFQQIMNLIHPAGDGTPPAIPQKQGGGGGCNASAFQQIMSLIAA
jgi:hypothetical protein